MAAAVASGSTISRLAVARAEGARMVNPGGVLVCSWGNSLFRHKIKLTDRRGAPIRFRKSRIAFPVCLLHGLGGPFWESSSDSSDDHFASAKTDYNLKKDKTMLLTLVQQIEPLDVSSISKDASVDSMDAMKRTISGMLGLLPSDQFKVTIEAYREPLARLLVSSMMTGYTLRNAEYRLCLQRSLELSEEENISNSNKKNETEDKNLQESISSDFHEKKVPCGEEVLNTESKLELNIPDNLGPLPQEVEDYVSELQAKLLSKEKELEDCKRAKTALEMEKIVGDENNDLLDYLRSLEPDKVAELSHPASKEVEEVIQTVISGLLDNLCKSRPLNPPQVNGALSSSPWEEGDSPELLSNVPLKFQSTVTATRDYLARLLFWCMLLGHHMRGLEYRLELSHALSLSGAVELGVED